MEGEIAIASRKGGIEVCYLGKRPTSGETVYMTTELSEKDGVCIIKNIYIYMNIHTGFTFYVYFEHIFSFNFFIFIKVC